VRVGLLVASLAFVAALAVLAPTGAAHEEGNHPVEIERSYSIPDVDTYQLAIRIPASQGNFNLAPGSYINATGFYVGAANGTVGDGTQEAAGLRGVYAYQQGFSCPNENGDDFCTLGVAGVSKKDLSQARVAEGSTGITFENDPNWWAWGSATASISWPGAARFDVPDTADQLTIRFLISIPDAAQLDVDVHLHSPQEIGIHDETIDADGFAYVGEDFDPAVHVDTHPAQVMLDGDRSVPLPADERLYAGFGPSWYGDSQTVTGTVGHNTVATSAIAYEPPTGDRTSGTAVSAFGWSGILVPGPMDPGLHTFEVDRHMGSGPQDLYLVGWHG
jgi:hypothetical protein